MTIPDDVIPSLILSNNHSIFNSIDFKCDKMLIHDFCLKSVRCSIASYSSAVPNIVTDPNLTITIALIVPSRR
jgi:hypothetical protein